MKRLASILCTALICFSAGAQVIRDLDITVVLQKDGSATVTQKWNLDVYRGTEWYVPIENLGPMTVSGLTVSENGKSFNSVGDRWDVDWSRQTKAGKCGIVQKSNGVELCWGLGEYGTHLWTVSFRLTGLVQGYDDADAFNFMFVNPGQDPAPQHVKLTIVPGFKTDTWNYDNTRVWAFGYTGDINVTDGAVVAESSEAFGYSNRLIALVKFSKGIFEPDVVRGGPVQNLIDRALDGSSYGDDTEGRIFDYIISFLMLFFLGGFIWNRIAVARGYKWKKALFGKKKIEGWYRDIPLEGDLCAAHYLMVKGPRLPKKGTAQNIIGAFFLKWIMDGDVKVEGDPASSKRVNLNFSKQRVSTDDVEQDLYNFAREAAGSNQLLEKNEFEKWSRKNYDKIVDWPERALKRGSNWFSTKGYFLKQDACNEEGAKEACHLIEFMNFLKDFTISDQREAVEVALWKNYLVYAQLFGIADKVAKQFKKLYPAEYHEIEATTGGDLSRTIVWTNGMSTRSFSHAVSNAGAINGTGGGASFGGGGGFSGGGFGGGAR